MNPINNRNKLDHTDIDSVTAFFETPQYQARVEEHRDRVVRNQAMERMVYGSIMMALGYILALITL